MAQHFDLCDHGTIVLVTAKTPAARAFVAESVDVPSWAVWGKDTFAVEPRYVAPLLEGFAAQHPTPEN